jgi:hypothetical protein
MRAPDRRRAAVVGTWFSSIPTPRSSRRPGATQIQKVYIERIMANASRVAGHIAAQQAAV